MFDNIIIRRDPPHNQGCGNIPQNDRTDDNRFDNAAAADRLAASPAEPGGFPG